MEFWGELEVQRVKFLVSPQQHVLRLLLWGELPHIHTHWSSQPSLQTQIHVQELVCGWV